MLSDVGGSNPSEGANIKGDAAMKKAGMIMNIMSGQLGISGFDATKALLSHKAKFKTRPTKKVISKSKRKAKQVMQKLSRKINRGL